MDLIELAKECGAGCAIDADDGTRLTDFSSDQLAAFAARIRADEREEILAVMKSRYDHEVAAAVHHASTWHAAHEFHMTRQAAMSDMLDAVRASRPSKEHP